MKCMPCNKCFRSWIHVGGRNYIRLDVSNSVQQCPTLGSTLCTREISHEGCRTKYHSIHEDSEDGHNIRRSDGNFVAKDEYQNTLRRQPSQRAIASKCLVSLRVMPPFPLARVSLPPIMVSSTVYIHIPCVAVRQSRIHRQLRLLMATVTDTIM